MTETLSKSLGVFKGAALLLNIVIGAGLLTLPGLAVEVAGDQAVASWLICAVATMPLLAVFIVLGRRYPNASGIANYAGQAFGPLGSRSASLILLGAVIFGLPSIALTGGQYLSAVFGGSPHVLALALLLCSIIPHVLPGEGASRAMAWIASVVIITILVFLAIGITTLKTSSAADLFSLPELDFVTAMSPFMMLFFAFTGWEVGAGIAEDFYNPVRDFPRAMILSFFICCVFYLAVAFVTGHTDLHGHYATPFVEIVRPLLGTFGATAVAVTAALIVFANLSGAVWAVSRLVYGLSREGALPAALGVTRGGRPIAAVVATVLTLCIVLIAGGLGTISLIGMLAIAGQNFLVLYGIAAASLAALAKDWRDCALALVVFLIVSTLILAQGAIVMYPIALFMVAAGIESLQRRYYPKTSL